MERCDIPELPAFAEQLREDLEVFREFEGSGYANHRREYVAAAERYREQLGFAAPVPDPGDTGSRSRQFEWLRDGLETVLAAAEAVLAARQVLDMTEDALCDALADLAPDRAPAPVSSAASLRSSGEGPV